VRDEINQLAFIRKSDFKVNLKENKDSVNNLLKEMTEELKFVNDMSTDKIMNSITNNKDISTTEIMNSITNNKDESTTKIMNSISQNNENIDSQTKEINKNIDSQTKEINKNIDSQTKEITKIEN
jgi:hypothetical protein